MDEFYRYPVYFDCKGLNEDQKRTIKDYFYWSCGGECGVLRKVDDKVYSVAFKHQKDQQRLLQKSEHVVAHAEGPLVFTVRESEEREALAESPRCAAATTSSSGEEYELQPDSLLIRYLSKSSKAWRELKSNLNKVSCSAQIHPEEGRVSVKSLVKPAARNWKSEVDQLFDGYLCHYEVDPQKVRVLLQSCSNKAIDEVKVYRENGIAVIVGKRSQVKARMVDLETSTTKSQGSSLAEKHSSICRLGEAKLHLLWNEINHRLGQDFPALEFSQGESGQLVLEGDVKEILRAKVCISDMQKLVLEKTVSDMSPHLLTFLKKAYKDPEVLRASVLGDGDEVVLEIRDAHLGLFSLSADNLEQAEKALQRHLKEVKLDVATCSAAPSELCEKLKSKTNEMNQGQCRVQAVFISDSTVCLLGHSKEVDELSDMVTQFILDESCLEGTHLPALKNPLGYVGSSTERSVGESLLQYIHPATTEGNMTVAMYSLNDGLQVLVCQGDITRLEADVLVNAANEDLDHCGGVAAALSKAGGPEVQKESKALVKQIGKIPTGEVVVTTGGNLKCKKLLHAVGPRGWKGGRERSLLETTVRSALEIAETMEFRSIAIPCISSGVSGVPIPVCSEAIVTAVKEFGRHGDQSLRKIILIDNREEVVEALQEACDRILQGKSTRNRTQTTETQQRVLKSRGCGDDVNKDSNTRRIILLGKTGVGKSSLGKTIFGEEVFTISHDPNSYTKKCQAETKPSRKRSLTLIDTPGLFDTERSEEEMQPEILKCITECSPGPHAFLILLKVDKFTKQENNVIEKICSYFSEDALKYVVVVFTHGEQLPEGMKIQNFVRKNKDLSDLVEKCGGRCHVVDNTYWNNKQQKGYRSNEFQVEELLNTVDKMVMETSGGYYTNEMLEIVEEITKKEEEIIQQSSGTMSTVEIRKKARSKVLRKILIQMTGIGTGVILGVFFGTFRLFTDAIKKNNFKDAAGLLTSLTTAILVAVAGGVKGGVAGHRAAMGAERVKEAAKRACKAVKDDAKAAMNA